ncbi:MAG: M48 family metallopeptidase, partial [bacterium]
MKTQTIRIQGAARLVCICAVIAGLTGCAAPTASFRGAPGSYHRQYNNLFATLSAKSLDWASTNTVWLCPRPIDAVWKTAIDIASQSQGVLGMHEEQDRRWICFMKGREAQDSAENKVRKATFGGFREQWVAVFFRSSPGAAATEVDVCFVDPLSLKTIPAPLLGAEFSACLQVHMFSVPAWHEKYVDIDWSRRHVRATAAQAKPLPRMIPQKEGNAKLIGDWMSKRMRLELGLVQSPDVVQSLEMIVGRIKAATGASQMQTRVYILASPHINAFALPNGDIFVSSGLLDTMDGPDQLAAVMAHEID